MRILWHSNAPWAKTGYGNQTAMFWHRIQALGYPVTLASNYGLQGSTLTVAEGDQQTVVYPTGLTTAGNDIIASHVRHANADILITLYDAWVFDPDVMSHVRWCPWLPIDHDPVPPPVLRAVKGAYQAIAYSQFGQDRLKRAGIDAAYVPHGVETKIMRPLPRAEALAKVQFPEALAEHDFLAVMVAANKGTPSRKCFPQVLRAWKAFVEDGHPNALLYMHTHAGEQFQGVNLEELLGQLGISQRNVLFADPYWNILGYPDEYMANLYSAADVLVSPSMGEGFGLPILEAQACGCPVIVGDWTSMPELTFAGWKLQGEPYYTPQASWQYIPYHAEIVRALNEAYEARGDRGMRNAAAKGALAYDADKVTRKFWAPLLAELAAEVEGAQAAEGTPNPLEMVSL
jgi:glycosyltransferase involved in cell wall biosynthesis